MKNLTLGSIFKPIIHFLGRIHMTLFIIFIAVGLSAAVLFLNDMLTRTAIAEDYTSPIDAGSIDQATLERIKELHTSNQKFDGPDLPSGRINPFGE